MFLLLLLFISYCLGSISFYESSEAISMTNSTIMQNKLRMTLICYSPGDFLLEWNAEIQSCNGGYVVNICLQQDSSITLNEHVWDPGINWGAANGFIVVPLQNGTHTFDIKYWSPTEGMNVAIRRARIKASEINL